QRDRVGLLLIDQSNETSLDVSLTTNYDSVRNACRTIQATADPTVTSSLDANISFASQQLQPSGQGRAFARKIIVLITDFNVTTSTTANADIDAYIAQPGMRSGWFHNIMPPLGTTDPRYEPDLLTRYARNGALMAAHQQSMSNGVETYAVKVGFASSKIMMDALADFGGTANTAKEAPSITNNPSLYESRIKAVLADIIDNPRGRLVQ
ncbi:MAG: vWA domain-containing protein, partial [Planctomycetota bacterium]